jgi:hypothetical protein
VLEGCTEVAGKNKLFTSVHCKFGRECRFVFTSRASETRKRIHVGCRAVQGI